jgi:hypothetical protein
MLLEHSAYPPNGAPGPLQCSNEYLGRAVVPKLSSNDPNEKRPRENPQKLDSLLAFPACPLG